MKYIVYIDRLFLLQAVRTLVLLLLTGAFLGRSGLSSAAYAARLVLGSGAEALFFCAVFLWPGIGGWIKRFLFAAASFTVLLLVFRIRTTERLWRAVFVYGAAGLLLAGFLYAMPGKGKAGTAVSSAFALTLAAVVSFWKRWERRRREETVVTAELAEGEVRIVTAALIDSGNTLYDPVSRKPVSVVERRVLEGRIDLDRPERFRLIPYHTLGGRGLMQAIEIEKMKVKKEGQEFLLEHAILGIYDGKVTENGSYQLILHPALLQEEKRVSRTAGRESHRSHILSVPQLRRNGRKHDIKSCDTGENTV